jgi:thiamine transporter ThiT
MFQGFLGRTVRGIIYLALYTWHYIRGVIHVALYAWRGLGLNRHRA